MVFAYMEISFAYIVFAQINWQNLAILLIYTLMHHGLKSSLDEIRHVQGGMAIDRGVNV